MTLVRDVAKAYAFGGPRRFGGIPPGDSLADRANDCDGLLGAWSPQRPQLSDRLSVARNYHGLPGFDSVDDLGKPCLGFR